MPGRERGPPGGVAGAVPRAGPDAAPTIRQVAAMAGVSTATVSRVLAQSGRVSPDLEARVRSAAKTAELPAQSRGAHLRARQGSTVGVLIPDIQNLFFTAIVRGIDDEVTRARLHGAAGQLRRLDRSRARLSQYVPRRRRRRPARRSPRRTTSAIYREFLRDRRAARHARPHRPPAERRPRHGHQPRGSRAGRGSTWWSSDTGASR